MGKSLVCKYDLKTKIFSINFSDIFSTDKKYDNFLVNKKRSYSKEEVLSSIQKAFNIIIENDNEDAIACYLYMQNKIVNDDDNEYTVEEFASDCEEFCSIAIKNIREYIEETYEEKKKRIKKNNEELQFKDEHSKLILEISMLIKLLIPIVSNYAVFKEIKNIDDLSMSCYEGCFKVTQKGLNISLENKLFKLIESRIKVTKYSDTPIWAVLRLHSIDQYTLTVEFYRKLIIDIFPKLDPSRTVISYLHATLKNQLGFLFRKNFQNFRSINLNEVTDSNNDRLTNFERLEFHMSKGDESETLIEESKRLDLIKHCLKNPKVCHSLNDKLDYYSNNIQINTIQIKLMFLYYAKMIGKIESMYGLRYKEYLTLLINFKYYLEENNFNFLAKWITARFPEGLKDSKKTINTKDFANNLLQSKSYKYLHDTKYSTVMSFLIKSNDIAKLISTIYTNVPEYIMSYEEFRDGKTEEETKKSEKFTLNIISDEVLKFLETI